MFKIIVAIMLSSVLTENFILAKYLGICPFLGVSKRTKPAVGLSAAITAVMVIATAVTWPLHMYFLKPLGLEYLQTVVFILVIAVLVQLLEAIIKKHLSFLYASLGVYLPLITTNCAVLGVTVLVVRMSGDSQDFGYLQSLIYAFSSGIGYLLAMILFSGVRRKIEHSDIPEFFKGLPSVLAAAAILALAFYGFGGIAEGLTRVSL